MGKAAKVLHVREHCVPAADSTHTQLLQVPHGQDRRKSLRTKEDRATAQALHIIPHLHRHLHLSSPRALFPNKNQIQAVSVSAMLVDTLTGQKQAKVSPLKKMATTSKRIIRNIVIFLAQIKENIIIHYVIKSIWFELSTKIQ